MGNLCSSSSDKDAFSQPGRTLNSARPQQRTSKPPKVGGPPRTLGGSGSGYGTNNAQSDQERIDARKAAAEAAEARARNAAKAQGKLGHDLAKQKGQNRRSVLEQISTEERRMRESDAAASARAHN